MKTKKKGREKLSTKQKKLLGNQPNQSRSPGEIQGFSKHLKFNRGQGRGQRIKAQS